jgi:fimbrial isopeptide formation D2 family protein/uncharacterized repeat protein (TIGR01451 family)
VGNIRRGLAFLAFWALASLPALSLAQVCAPPGLLLTTIPPGGIINDYYAGSGTPSLNAGVSSFTLGTRDGRGYTSALVIGDLLMVMQMQDGTIDSSNNSNYGDGTGVGAGSTSVGKAGLFEFVRITAVAGLNVTVTPPLTNSYINANATATTSQQRYQVVRSLQFSSVNTSSGGGGIIAPAWNGDTGGVVSIDVRDTLTLGSGTIEGQTNRAIYVAGKGFRGGAGLNLTGNAAAAAAGDYAVPSTVKYHASKGEGIIGTPLNINLKTGNWSFQTTNPITAANLVTAQYGTFEGYPGGSFARGAPGNAGGGGVDSTKDGNNANNSGGGGGSNYGKGGIGGRPWNDPLLDLGGRGGASYAGTLAFNRLFLGGGGGAGDTNNATADAAAYTNLSIGCTVATGICSGGAPGGGVIVIRARQVTGNGVIDARGAHAYNINNDGGGGGGAGGSVVIQTPNGGSAVVDVTGGDGGNAFANDNNWPSGRHGPGGAGGGGFVAYAPNTMAVSASYAGGAPGETESKAVATGKPVPDYYGAQGFNGGLTAFQSPNVPGVPQAALCDPNLSLAKTDGVTSLSSPGTDTYTFTITNNGNSDSFGTVTFSDKLPPGVSVSTGTLTLGGPNAGSFSCVAANATDINCTSNVTIPGNGGTRVFTIGTTVNGVSGLSVVNKAVVSGGGDPNKTATATVSQASACTSDGTPAGCAVDVDTIVAPNLSLTKTDGTTTVARGATVTYLLTVSNTGGSTTVGTITVADLLSTGLTYTGASPFTVNNFTCTVSGQGITCNRTVALAASASATITYSAVVTGAVSSVLNLAEVGGGGDPNPNKSTLPTTATAALCPAPVSPASTASDPATGCAADADAVSYVQLSLSKDDGKAFASQNGFTDYVYVVRNIGTIPTSGQLNFRDVLPWNTTTFVATGASFNPSGTNGADWTCDGSTAQATACTSSISVPAGGSSSFVLRVSIGNLAGGTQIFNKARVGGGGDVSAGIITSPTVANVQACVGDGSPQGCATDLDTVQASAEIRVVKTHPNPQAHSVGDTFSFTLAIRNSGGTSTGNANTVRLVDVVPPNLTINSITPSSSFACAAAGQVITCNNTAGIAAGTTRTVVVSVTVAAGATNSLVNRAAIATNDGADPQNNTFPTAATVALCSGTDKPQFGCTADPVPLNADLQMVKDQRAGTAGAFQTTLLGVALGDVVQYRLTISNAAGSALVTNATFYDPVPFHVSGLGTVSFTTAGGASGCTAAFTGTQLNGTVTSLPAGSNCTVIVQGTATTSTAGATNTAVVTAPAGIIDTVPGNNTSTVLTAIGVANLAVTKTDGTTTVAAGGSTSYTIVATNGGPSPANGTRIYDPVATGLSCTATPVCVASGAASCPVGLTMAQLQNTTAPAGVAIPTFGSGGSITITVTCGITATGQ